MAYLELKNVSYTYPNGYEAVKNINMSFELGESVAIIGQNGAGKTTTVKMMNALLLPVKGEVVVDGQSTVNTTTAQIAKKVGYVFQNPNDQIFQDTIYNEIAFGLKKQKMSKAEIDRRVHESAALCGMEGHLQDHPYDLPYSRRKFVTMAAIIAMDTKVIILDEPTAGQDWESTKLLGEIINKLTEQNKTVITITHDMEFVVRQFKRVIVMANKEKQTEDTPDHIFWDKELLKRSALKQPYICELANLLGHKGIMNITELANAVI